MSKVTTAAETAGLVDRSTFLSAGNGRRFKIVNVPGLGRVRLRSLKESERSRFETDTLSDAGETERDRLETAKRRLIVECVVDANGEMLLDAGDVDALGEKDGAITGFLFDECRQHCGFAKGDIEKLVGNSGPTPAADSR